MELSPVLRKLAAVVGPDGRIVTLTLDVSRGSTLPPESRVFFKNRVLARLAGDPRSPLEKIGRRIERYVDSERGPESNGLFLAAGEDVWEAVDLMVPLRNFVHVGRRPYLAPLVEVAQRWPRAYVARLEASEAAVEEVSLGAKATLGRFGKYDIPRDPQHALTGTRLRTGTNVGGSSRDRWHQSEEETVHAMIRSAAERINALHAGAPAEAVYVFGDREYFGVLSDHLRPELRERTAHLGHPSIEHRIADRELVERVSAELEARARARVDREIREFQERRARGYLVALGPAEVIKQMMSGTVVRIFVHPDDPVPGTLCASCGTLGTDTHGTCPSCGTTPVETSLTEEIVPYALAHAPLSITFVPRRERWLEELGGLAALLAPTDLRRMRRQRSKS